MTSVDRDMDKVAAKPERKAILIEGEFRLDFQERKTPGGWAWERPLRMMEALTAPGHGCAVALTLYSLLRASVGVTAGTAFGGLLGMGAGTGRGMAPAGRRRS
jgi:hypothetical protein